MSSTLNGRDANGVTSFQITILAGIGTSIAAGSLPV
jgi:hypothetical protein